MNSEACQKNGGRNITALELTMFNVMIVIQLQNNNQLSFRIYNPIFSNARLCIFLTLCIEIMIRITWAENLNSQISAIPIVFRFSIQMLCEQECKIRLPKLA